ncbi:MULTISPECIES: TrmO family methyltransferase domain-containing protein [Nocardiopsis]|uniref:TrmO family methyltransferase domain-containing protein n=1 Tax=Nocardiopsis TaxID=2013 RepID=UPI001C846A88
MPAKQPRLTETGTSVHRTHRRPGRLAVSHSRLLRIDGRDLHVEDLDAVDGTPALCLAPGSKNSAPAARWNSRHGPERYARTTGRPNLRSDASCPARPQAGHHVHPLQRPFLPRARSPIRVHAWRTSSMRSR